VTIAAEVEAEIARLFAVEHWKVGTIADQLGVHHDVVRRVLGLLPEGPRRERPPLLVAPYEGFVKETLERYPRLCSTRLLDMLRERGFRGSERTLRRFVAMVRPTSNREAFLRLDPLIGEQAQIDWAHVGPIAVLVAVDPCGCLSWSCPGPVPCGANSVSTSASIRSCARYHERRPTLAGPRGSGFSIIPDRGARTPWRSSPLPPLAARLGHRLPCAAASVQAQARQ